MSWKQVSIEMAGRHDAQCAVRCSQTSLIDRPAKAAGKSAKCLDLRIALPQSTLSTSEIRPPPLRRDCGSRRCRRPAPRARSHRAQPGKCAYVCECRRATRDAVGLQLADLRGSLRLHLVRVDASRKRPQGESGDAVAKRVAVFGSMRLGTRAASTSGLPSNKTTWQPTLQLGSACASSTASSNASEFAISVVEVTMPRSRASTIARFTPEVKPKSSALMMSRRTRKSVARDSRQDAYVCASLTLLFSAAYTQAWAHSEVSRAQFPRSRFARAVSSAG